MRPSAAIAAVIAAFALTGCTSQGGTMSTPSAPESRPSFQTMSPLGSPSAVATDVSSARWAAIVADLTGRGVTGTPTVISAESVTWNDSSLGCPKPGMMYSQVITPGMKVVVAVEGKTFDYRFGRSDTPTLCTA